MATPRMLSSTTVVGDKVVNLKGDDLGKIEDVMLDLHQARIAYAVLSFGGVLGMGDKLFAVPWSALKVDGDKKRFTLDVPKERLENAPGFNKDHWPNFADPTFGKQIAGHYGTSAYA